MKYSIMIGGRLVPMTLLSALIGTKCKTKAERMPPIPICPPLDKKRVYEPLGHK